MEPRIHASYSFRIDYDVNDLESCDAIENQVINSQWFVETFDHNLFNGNAACTPYIELMFYSLTEAEEAFRGVVKIIECQGGTITE